MLFSGSNAIMLHLMESFVNLGSRAPRPRRYRKTQTFVCRNDNPLRFKQASKNPRDMTNLRLLNNAFYSGFDK